MKPISGKCLFDIASNIQSDINDTGLRSLEEPVVTSSQIIPESLFRDCGKTYLTRIAREVNSSYENGIHCCCAVLIRRLIESCMIEAFEQKHKADLIKTGDGNYKGCSDILTALRNNPFNNLSRNTRKALNNNKIIKTGDNGAHDRFWIPRKQDIDKIKDDSRTVIEYLVHQF